MTHQLGAIESDVNFSFEDADALEQALNSAAQELENQQPTRAGYVREAGEEFRGYFSTVFADNAAVASADGQELVNALRDAAGLVGKLAEQARAENERRRIAREYLARHDDWWEKDWDWLMGQEIPPVGAASEPLPQVASEPVASPRDTPLPGQAGAGGGVSSAVPEQLRVFSDGSPSLNNAVDDQASAVSTAYSDFQASCGYGSLEASGLLLALKAWNDANKADASWVGFIAQAFEDAGSKSGALVGLPDSALQAALEAAGLTTYRQDLSVVVASALGGQPTAGYTLDPVNTGNGNFIEPETDLQFTGAASSLSLIRMYNSRGASGGVFGCGWSSVLDVELRFDDDCARWLMADGRQLTFARSGASFLRAEGENYWLVPAQEAATVCAPVRLREGARWAVVDNAGGGWFFTATGVWVGYAQVEGQAVYVERASTGELTRLVHERGRWVECEYSDGRVVVARASDGRRIEYDYSPSGLLVRAKR
ncbi:MAG: DUF6531 domain-containing protein [Rothia sp. (in: high G+C Gram-positive bacteria)]|nr:DUF6531 domain-containing protein [Rothia sp. (in: high G+C Gram-positive bacteria)]